MSVVGPSSAPPAHSVSSIEVVRKKQVTFGDEQPQTQRVDLSARECEKLGIGTLATRITDSILDPKEILKSSTGSTPAEPLYDRNLLQSFVTAYLQRAQDSDQSIDDPDIKQNIMQALCTGLSAVVETHACLFPEQQKKGLFSRLLGDDTSKEPQVKDYHQLFCALNGLKGLSRGEVKALWALSGLSSKDNATAVFPIESLCSISSDNFQKTGTVGEMQTKHQDYQASVMYPLRYLLDTMVQKLPDTLVGETEVAIPPALQTALMYAGPGKPLQALLQLQFALQDETCTVVKNKKLDPVVQQEQKVAYHYGVLNALADLSFLSKQEYKTLIDTLGSQERKQLQKLFSQSSAIQEVISFFNEAHLSTLPSSDKLTQTRPINQRGNVASFRGESADQADLVAATASMGTTRIQVPWQRLSAALNGSDTTIQLPESDTSFKPSRELMIASLAWLAQRENPSQTINPAQWEHFQDQLKTPNNLLIRGEIGSENYTKSEGNNHDHIVAASQVGTVTPEDRAQSHVMPAQLTPVDKLSNSKPEKKIEPVIFSSISQVNQESLDKHITQETIKNWWQGTLLRDSVNMSAIKNIVNEELVNTIKVTIRERLQKNTQLSGDEVAGIIVQKIDKSFIEYELNMYANLYYGGVLRALLRTNQLSIACYAFTPEEMVVLTQREETWFNNDKSDLVQQDLLKFPKKDKAELQNQYETASANSLNNARRGGIPATMLRILKANNQSVTNVHLNWEAGQSYSVDKDLVPEDKQLVLFRQFHNWVKENRQEEGS